jgi:hypothetical protein
MILILGKTNIIQGILNSSKANNKSICSNNNCNSKEHTCRDLKESMITTEEIVNYKIITSIFCYVGVMESLKIGIILVNLMLE